MTPLEMESSGLSGAMNGGLSILIVLASWLVRMEQRRFERKTAAGWDLSLSLRLDRLMEIREQLSEYLASARRRP